VVVRSMGVALLTVMLGLFGCAGPRSTAGPAVTRDNDRGGRGTAQNPPAPVQSDPSPAATPAPAPVKPQQAVLAVSFGNEACSADALLFLSLNVMQVGTLGTGWQLAADELDPETGQLTERELEHKTELSGPCGLGAPAAPGQPAQPELRVTQVYVKKGRPRELCCCLGTGEATLPIQAPGARAPADAPVLSVSREWLKYCERLAPSAGAPNGAVRIRVPGGAKADRLELVLRFDDNLRLRSVKTGFTRGQP